MIRHIIDKSLMKRKYVPFGIYHIVWSTKRTRPLLLEDIFCNVLIDCIDYFSENKGYMTIAYKINPDHIHLVIKVGEEFNVSDIVHSLKRNSSFEINKIVLAQQGDGDSDRLKFIGNDLLYATMLGRKYGGNQNLILPKFSWNKGFNETYIWSKSQFANTIQYVLKQSHKHGLPENHFCFVDMPLVNKFMQDF